MGDTSRQACLAGGVDALEGVFGYGCAFAVCRPASGGRGDDGCLSRVRRLAQDRLQDLRSVQGAWARGADRSLAPAGAIRQPVGAADRATHRRLQAREASLGRSQGPRTAGSAVGSGLPHPGQEHDPRGPAPARPRQTAWPAAPARNRNAAFGGSDPKWALVRRFQRRVQAGRRALLLPADRHRLCLTLPSAV